MSINATSPVSCVIYNGRIYTPNTVKLDEAIFCNNGVISHIVPENINEIYSLKDYTIINAENNIVAPGFINISFDLGILEDAIENAHLIGEISRHMQASGVIGVCPIVPLAGIERCFNLFKENIFGNLRVLGVRVDCTSQNEKNFAVIDYLLNHSNLSINFVDFIVADLRTLEYVLKYKREHRYRICMRLSPLVSHEDDLEDVDCVCGTFSEIMGIPNWNKWVELKMPSFGELADVGKLRDRFCDYSSLLVGNYWTQNDIKDTDISELRAEMFTTSFGKYRFSTQNQTVRFLNRQLGIPLPYAFAICTSNPSSYVGFQQKMGKIDVGQEAHLVLLDGKLDIIRIIGHE
jgi:hypothetical protein